MYVLDIFCAAVAILVRIQYLGSASKLGALRTKRGDQGRDKKITPTHSIKSELQGQKNGPGKHYGGQ